MRDLPFTRDWRFRAGLVATAISLVMLALVPSQVLEPKFGARSIAFSPKTMPVIALTLMAILGALMAIGPALARQDPEPSPPEGLPQIRVLLPIGLMVAFVASIDQIGLVLASGLCITALAYLFGNRNAWVIAILATAVPGAIWLIFARSLRIFLPEGRLFEGLL